MADTKKTTTTSRKKSTTPKKSTTTKTTAKKTPTTRKSTRKTVISDDNNPLIGQDVEDAIDKLATPVAKPAEEQPVTENIPTPETEVNGTSETVLQQQIAEAKATETVKEVPTAASIRKKKISLEKRIADASDAELQEMMAEADNEKALKLEKQRVGRLATVTVGNKLKKSLQKIKDDLKNFGTAFEKVIKNSRNPSQRRTNQNIIFLAVVVDNEEIPISDRMPLMDDYGRIVKVVHEDEHALTNVLEEEMTRRIGLEGWQVFSFSSNDTIEVMGNANLINNLYRMFKGLMGAKKKRNDRLGMHISKTYGIK
ncbi:MAG: hypothetical protein AAGJ18_14500 [Bacteroidota bacterium]